ncbi:MAG: type II secretion system protein GspK, partial [Hyphomonadaceae bacterium]
MMLALATVLASAAALLAHGDAMDVAQLRVRVEQRAALESAWTLVLARISETQAADPIAIGQSVRIAPPEVDAAVLVDLADESGRIDLNAADDAVLLAYWRARGLSEAQSEQWLNRLRDWQDGDDIARPDGAEFVEYRNASVQVMPRNARLAAVRELAQILSDTNIDPDCDANSFSVYTGAPEPNVLVATGEVKSMLEWADRQQWRGRRWLPDNSIPGSESAALIGRVLRITLKTGVKPNQLNDDAVASITNTQVADR